MNFENAEDYVDSEGIDGTLIECDPVIKQLLLHLNENELLGGSFIIKDLDSSHLFISSAYIDSIQTKIWDMMDKLSYTEN